MELNELFEYAYIKRPLNELYRFPSEVPFEFLMEWYKDTFDCQRLHSDEEIAEFISFKPEDILEWLENAVRLTWEAKKAIYFSSNGE